jgi:GH35 family endo-1,4-beta-xylanase
LTPENSMKWDATERKWAIRETETLEAHLKFSFSGTVLIHRGGLFGIQTPFFTSGAFGLDSHTVQVDFASSNDKLIRGHTLGMFLKLPLNSR